MKVNVTVEEKCYHPATGLELIPGEMDVSAKQAEVLVRAGLATAEKMMATDDAPKQPRKRREE